MAFFSSSSSSFSSISQPKMRQEGFHLPSPSPSSGQPPSPPPGPFDLFLTHSSHHAHQSGNSNSTNGPGSNGNGNLNNGNGSGLPSLSLPDAFSRTNAMDLTDELAMSLMNPASPATSNERSTHTPPAHQNQGHSGEQTHMHNIFDISAPPSHFSNTSAGGHAFSLPHTSHRPDLPPMSQPASLATSHLHGHYDHHQSGGYHNHNSQHGFLGGRDTFPAHFNSTIPPLSSHHDAHPPPLGLSTSGANDLPDPFGPFTPTSSSSMPARDSESPQPLAAGRKRADSRSATGGGGSPSRSRSRARTGSQAQAQSQSGPTRTTKSSNRRRDSFTLPPHLSHSHSHSHSSSGNNQTQLGHHLQSLPSPPGGSGHRPSSIVIPPHGGPGGALSPLGNMGGLGSALSPLGPGPGHLNGNGPGIGQASGWFGINDFKGVNGVNINGINGHNHPMSPGANPGSAPGAEFSLPTPDSIGHGPFGAFGTSVGSMGISPKDTVTSGIGKDNANPDIDPASKQAALVNEKRRRRRESHNAVERRRRDNINEKISELATLIPEVMLDPTASLSSGSGGNDDKKDKDGDCGSQPDIADERPPTNTSKTKKGSEKENKDGGQPQVKANKGMILRKSVEYIRYLQQLVGAQAARNRALEDRLAQAGISPPTSTETLPPPLPGANSQADDLSGIFGTEGLHAFDDRMELGVNGIGSFAAHFGSLEPMAEMDMDMDIEVEGANSAGRQRQNGQGSSDAGDDRDGDEQYNDNERDHGSPLSGSDASSPRDHRDASSDRSERSAGCGGMEREERGRRGRDGKVHTSGAVQKSPSVSSLTGKISRRRSKLVAVKEEASGMEV